MVLNERLFFRFVMPPAMFGIFVLVGGDSLFDGEGAVDLRYNVKKKKNI